MIQQPLVTTGWLAENLDNPDIRIVDIRGHVISASEPLPHYFNHRTDYELSHIPGAVFVDWVHEITDPSDPRHAQIAKPERFAEVMSRIGVTSDTLVVAYDDASGMFAARLWWSLNYYGHENVVVLDGGWNKWIAEDRPITSEIPPIQLSTFTPQRNPDIYRDANQVEAALNSATKLIDVRTPQEFNGESSRASRKGHIPGAINIPRGIMITPEGTMLSPDELRKQFAEAGIDETTPDVVCYCNGGVSASYGLLALRVAGLDNGAVYDGSWKDWGNDSTKPIE